MKVTTEPRENRQLALTIEVEPERVEAALTKAVRHVANKYTIPGFRKGKAPRHVVEQMFGKEALFQEALDDLGQAVYAEALEQEKIEPYGPGQLEDVQRDPLVLKMLIPLAPEVEVGDYRSLRVPFEAPGVDDDEINHQIEHLRERHVMIEPAPEDAGVDWGHLATLEIQSTIEGEPFISRNNAGIVVEKEQLDHRIQVLPGFEEQIIGMKPGEQKTFSLPIPDEDNFGERRGKTAEFNVTLKETKLRTLPDADDALAQTVGDFETIDALRDAIHKDIADAKMREADSKYIDQVIDKLLEMSRIEFPNIMVEEELDAMIERTEQRLKDQGLGFEQYLKMLSKTRDEYRQEMRPTADGRIRRGLLLSKLVELESLDVDQADVDKEIESTSAAYGERAKEVRSVLSSEKNVRSIRLELLTQKVLDRLKAIARDEAPEATQPVTEVA